jgi:hypothetical protein
VRALLFKGLVVVALILAVVVPAAAAKSGATARLSVLPLPASSLGSAASSLPLEADSGVVSNTSYLANAFPDTPNRSLANTPIEPAKLGRVTGYALDYGQGATGGAGVTEVWTGVDEYKTSAHAKSGLGFWRRWDRNFAGPPNPFSITAEREKVPAVGGERFAVLVSFRAANIAPLFGLDEQFTVGRYLADVTVWAGTAAAAETLAPRLAKKLEARIRLALAGRLHAKPVELPARPKAGPSPGGPDLAPLALQTSDLSGPAVGVAKYLSDRLPLSYYNVSMAPAGQFDILVQEIFWWPTANEAAFNADFLLGLPGQDPLGLSSIGDGARGVLWNSGYPDNGTAQVVFSSGQLEEVLALGATNAIQPSQVQSIAQIVANKINAAGLGS